MIRRLASIPPAELPRRAAGALRREGGFALQRAIDQVRRSYAAELPVGPLIRIFPAPPIDELRAIAPELAAACERDLAHEFDLLGSGPVRVAHGVAAIGTAGHRHDSTPRPGERVNAANRAEARRIRGLIDADYAPIDWHLDFKSGFRWDESTWWRDVPIGHLPGVDVKVPWELSRMQHLPRLACAGALAAAGEPGFAAPERYAREIRNQILDWIAANPPRWSVNWRMPMDVALRVVSWLVARDLLAARGVGFDDGFERVFQRSVREHATHLIHHLEWNREVRGNHYFANVAGLLFCAAYLPRGRATDAWLAWAVQELGAETELQFASDGSSFEASTAYHCLGMEMVAWCTALIRALPAQKAAAIADARPRDWTRHPPLRPGAALPPAHAARVRAMVGFAAALTKPSGLMAQIGDNDSGRFLPIRPPRPVLDPREPTAVAATLGGLTAPGEAAAAMVAGMVAERDAGGGGPSPVSLGLATLSHLCQLTDKHGTGEHSQNTKLGDEGGAREGSAFSEIRVGGGGLRDGGEVLAFPDFG
ncbi:MAG TPA: heparinase II/III family protein, partial [Longimicrobium sp.]